MKTFITNVKSFCEKYFERDYDKFNKLKLENPDFFNRPDNPYQWMINLALFFVTCITLLYAGSWFVIDYDKSVLNADLFTRMFVGSSYAFSVMSILLAHEFGHYLPARLTGMKASLPYLLPVPPNILPFGTLGAIIRIKSPIPNKVALMRMASIGPIAGFVVTIIVLIMGFNLSYIENIADPKDFSGIIFGNNLVMSLLESFFIDPSSESTRLVVHPMVFAGWFGMLVTGLNLLPVGQLDGGHILYALTPKFQKWFGYLFVIIIFILSFFYYGWLLWVCLILMLIKVNHPKTENDKTKLTRWDVVLGIVSILILIISFIPFPIDQILNGETMSRSLIDMITDLFDLFNFQNVQPEIPKSGETLLI